MISRWLAQLNQRERILALSVAGILFLLINLAFWSVLFGMSAGARSEFAQLARSVKGQLEVAESMARSGAYAE